MKIVREMLRSKGFDVYAVSPDSTVYEALELMAAKGIGATLVFEENRIVGIFSERDYARKVILLGKHSKEIPVREIMTRRVICVRPDQSAEECLALMTEKRVRHLPVVVEEEVVGVISIGDVVKEIIAGKQFLIEQLESYIKGS
jgi:CBS domain-containing protein